MRKTFIMLVLAFTSPLAYSAHRSSVKKAYVDRKGWVHILSVTDHDHTIQPEKWQDGGGFEDVDVASDGRTVGWLADQMLTPLEGGANYSYAVALRLDIWRDGRVIRSFPAPALVIQNWIFLNNGAEVAIHIAPPHGQDSEDCWRFDVQTGKELAHWSANTKSSAMPDWARRLLSATARSRL